MTNEKPGPNGGRVCPHCNSEEGCHGGCNCGHLKAWTPKVNENSTMKMTDFGEPWKVEDWHINDRDGDDVILWHAAISPDIKNRIAACVNFCQHLSTETLQKLTENRIGAATLAQWIRRCNTFSYVEICDGEIFDEPTVCIECDHRVDKTGIHPEDCLLKQALYIIGKDV